MFTRYLPCVCVLFPVAANSLTAQDKPLQDPVRLGSARFANLGRVFAIAYSDDGRLLAGGAWDGSIRVWETATAKPLQQIKGLPVLVDCLGTSIEFACLFCRFQRVLECFFPSLGSEPMIGQ